MNGWDSLNPYHIIKKGGSCARGCGDRCKLDSRLPNGNGEPISSHGEPGRDDYWTDLEREQFESNADM